MVMEESLQAIQKQLQKRNIKRDADVRELYLSHGRLSDVIDLRMFLNLNVLWLNNNHLTRLDFLHGNFRLSELHLNNNDLKTIKGQLQHLTCLQVLSLHNNQLEKLDKVLAEFANMQYLKKLNLFNNPVAQEDGYRIYTIHHVPSLKMLDRQEVLKLERDLGRKLYDQVQEQIKDAIGFGRRSQGPPNYSAMNRSPSLTKPADYEVGNNYTRNAVPLSEEEALTLRIRSRSHMQWSYFDWSQIPRSLERRTAEKPLESNAQIVTVKFQ